MGSEVFGLRRRAVGAQVVRRRADDPPVGHETPRDQGGIGGGRDPHGDVDALVHHVDQPVGKQNVDPYIGEARDEFGHQRHDLALAERNGGRHPQPPPGLVRRIADGTLRRIDIREDGLRSFVEFAADIRQADPARRPVEQARAEPRFETADLLGDRRRRNAQNPRGRRKVTGIHSGDKYRHLDTRRGRRHILFPEFTDNMPNEAIIIFHGINYKCATLEHARIQTGEIP